jgi:Domain of unknown function (DUF932)
VAQSTHDLIMGIYRDAPDQQDIHGTAWGFLQAVGNYVDHGAVYRKSKNGTRDENRFIRTVLAGTTIADEAARLVGAL